MLESVEVDELLVDVLTVIASAAFAKKKIYLLVDRPEDFGCEFLVSGNSVLYWMLSFVIFLVKLRSWLDRMLASPKIYLLMWA